jgi:LmbE family N-acetylglucosaminyl deacetylase
LVRTLGSARQCYAALVCSSYERSDIGDENGYRNGGVGVNVLAIGAHPDDVEIGCGGALTAHRRRGDRVMLLIMTSGERGPQDVTSRVHEQEEAAKLLGADVCWAGFEDGFVPEGKAAVDVVQSVLAECNADVVYTHAPADTHQDHRATALATMSACRRLHHVLHYESPTSVGFQPTLYVDLEGLLEDKVGLIRAHFSQVLKNGLVDLAAVEATARFRGFGARLHMAEAFETGRFVWDLSVTAPLRYEHSETAQLDLGIAHSGR